MPLIIKKFMDDLCDIFDDLQDDSVHQKLIVEFKINDKKYIRTKLNEDIEAAQDRIRELRSPGIMIGSPGNNIKCEVTGPTIMGNGVKVRFIITEQ